MTHRRPTPKFVAQLNPKTGSPQTPLSHCINQEKQSWNNKFLVFSIDSSYIYIQEG